MLMNEISELLKGNDMQKDCAYHLLQYRYLQFPSILKSTKITDDTATITSFLESIALNDFLVCFSRGVLYIERHIAHSASGFCSHNVYFPGSTARTADPARDSAVHCVDPCLSGVR